MAKIDNSWSKFWLKSGLNRYEYHTPPWILFTEGLVPGNSEILDVGCGDGLLMKKLMKNKNCNVCGIDISKKAVKCCKRRGIKNVMISDVLEGGVCLKKKFDVIILSEVLSFILDPIEMLIKIKPYLKPSGKVLISIANSASYINRFYFLFGKLEKVFLDKLKPPFLIHAFTKEKIKNLIKKSDFDIIQWYSIGWLPLSKKLLGKRIYFKCKFWSSFLSSHFIISIKPKIHK